MTVVACEAGRAYSSALRVYSRLFVGVNNTISYVMIIAFEQQVYLFLFAFPLFPNYFGYGQLKYFA